MKRKQLTFIVILLSSLCLFTAAGIFAGETPASSTDLSVKWGELTCRGRQLCQTRTRRIIDKL